MKGDDKNGLFESVGKAADKISETSVGKRVGAVVTILLLAILSGGANMSIIHDYFNGKLPECFAGYFTLSSDAHDHATRNAGQGHLFVPFVESERYGRKSFKIQSILLWNNFAEKCPTDDFINLSRLKFKKMLMKHFIDN